MDAEVEVSRLAFLQLSSPRRQDNARPLRDIVRKGQTDRVLVPRTELEIGLNGKSRGAQGAGQCGVGSIGRIERREGDRLPTRSLGVDLADQLGDAGGYGTPGMRAEAVQSPTVICWGRHAAAPARRRRSG